MKLAVLLLAAGFSLAAPQSGDGQQLCSIQGSVTNSVSKEPLRKAYLLLYGRKSYPAVTDDQGKFSIDKIEPDSYTLTAEHDGFVAGPLADAFGSVVQIKLASGQVVRDVEIKLTPQAVISGRVVDEDGDPWPYGSVNILRSVWAKGGGRLQPAVLDSLDDRGEFRIAHLKPGLYYLTAQPDSQWEIQHTPDTGNAPQPHQITWYPSSPDAAGASAITVGPGDQLGGLEIRLRRGSEHRIRGALVGLSKALSRDGMQNLFASAPSSEGGLSRGGVIHPDGSFEIDHLPPGTYYVEAQIYQNPFQTGHAQLRIEDRDLEGVSIQMTELQKVKGTIQVAEGGSIQPSEVLATMADAVVVSAGPDAGFMWRVEAGRHRVEVNGRGFYLKEVRYCGAVSTDGTVDIVASGGDLVVVVSTRGGHLSGTVKRSTDQPPDPAFPPQVVLIPKDSEPPQRAVFDQTGAFSFENPLAPGDYKLYAFEGAPDGAWEDAEFLKEVASSGVDIHLVQGDSKTTEVTLLSRSDLVPILRKLGME